MANQTMLSSGCRTVPMIGLQLGTPREGFPFDAEELVRLIKKESETG